MKHEPLRAISSSRLVIPSRACCPEYELLVGATVLSSVAIMAADYQYAGDATSTPCYAFSQLFCILVSLIRSASFNHIPVRVQVPNYKVSTPNHDYNAVQFRYFGPLGYRNSAPCPRPDQGTADFGAEEAPPLNC